MVSSYININDNSDDLQSPFKTHLAVIRTRTHNSIIGLNIYD